MNEGWGRNFDPERLADLELGMWKAYYRHQGARLFGLLIRANHAQAGVGWFGATRAAFYLARAAVGFSRTPLISSCTRGSSSVSVGVPSAMMVPS